MDGGKEYSLIGEWKKLLARKRNVVGDFWNSDLLFCNLVDVARNESVESIVQLWKKYIWLFFVVSRAQVEDMH